MKSTKLKIIKEKIVGDHLDTAINLLYAEFKGDRDKEHQLTMFKHRLSVISKSHIDTREKITLRFGVAESMLNFIAEIDEEPDEYIFEETTEKTALPKQKKINLLGYVRAVVYLAFIIASCYFLLYVIHLNS